MAADTHVTGVYFAGVGTSMTEFSTLFTADTEVIDNARGSEPLYAVPAGADRAAILPRNDGQVISLPKAPHVPGGQFYMSGVRPTSANAAADVDTTGASSDVHSFTAVIRDRRIGRKLRRPFPDETERFTGTGAPPTDPSLNDDSLQWVYFWETRVPTDWTIVDFYRVDFRSAT